jgi:hypothetical protein
MKFIVKALKTVAVILITAVAMLIVPIGAIVVMVFISALLLEVKLISLKRHYMQSSHKQIEITHLALTHKAI